MHTDHVPVHHILSWIALGSVGWAIILSPVVTAILLAAR